MSASLLREKELLRELSILAQQQDLMAEEFEHRLGNSLQMVVSLLALQSLAASTPETAAQLTIAAGRVAAFGRVHRRLHLHDRQKSVDFKLYLQSLCGDLADLMLQKNGGRSVIVTGADIVLPTALGVPLGFLVSEAITNSVKYTAGRHHCRHRDALCRSSSFRYRMTGPDCRRSLIRTKAKSLE